jgi:hypothetical protein
VGARFQSVQVKVRLERFFHPPIAQLFFLLSWEYLLQGHKPGTFQDALDWFSVGREGMDNWMI